MFTTDSGFGWHASPDPIGTAWFEGRKVTLSHRGIANLAARLADGQPQDDAIRDVLYRDRDFGHAVVGWWEFIGRKNPWRMVGRIQICRTFEYGEIRYTATSTIPDHASTTLPHLLGRLARMQRGSAKAERAKAKRKPRHRVLSDGEVWARRAEDGWGPGGY